MLRYCFRLQPALAVVAACAMLIAGCSGGPQNERGPGQSNSGGGIIVAATADAESMHPYKTTDTASGQYEGLVYSGSLTERDPEHVDQFKPSMAESWTVGDDKVTYTFKLRPDLVWSDGQPLTADDFKWTFDQATKPENAWPYITTVQDIESYEAPDAHTIQVRLKEPLAIGLEMADAITPLPRHIWETLDWNNPGTNPQIMAPTVGSGPFLLKEWKKDDHATFVPNERYYKGKPKLASYTIQVVPDPRIAYQKLRAGEVDESTFAPDDYADAKRLDNVTVYEWWPATGNWTYLGFNLRQPILQDKQVRQALAYAIDRKTIIDRVMYGLAEETYSAYGPNCWCYNPDVPHRDYDPEKTKAMLDQAGWRPGPDGIRVKDGQRLHLRLVYGPQSSKIRTALATITQDSFKQVGVEVEISGLEWVAYLQALKTPPYTGWDMNVGSWQATIDPHWMFEIWNEDDIPDLNAGAYVNKQVEKLFDDGKREFDQAKRKQIYGQIQSILTEDQPYIFLYVDKAYTGLNNRIGGIKPSSLGLEWNIQDWYVK
ncbi:MAG TPA: ABC transporter substrate-binding protein [Chloroflexota bacterium]|jgi:peptide/nickel transport system substrate-binding protein